MDDVHLLCAVVEHGSGIEVTLVANAMTAAEQLGTLLDGTLHLLSNTLQSASLHQRTHVYGVVLADIAHLDGRHLLNQNLGELSLHLLLHIDALGIVANLAIGCRQSTVLPSPGRHPCRRWQEPCRPVRG